MRRIGLVLTALMLILALAVTAGAVTGASSLESHATVSVDGSCQVTVTATLHLEQAVDKLYFPVPADASGVTLNGSRVSAAKDGDARRVDLSKLLGNAVGDFSINIHYSLYDVIHTTEAGTLEMQIPLLSGFEYPVEAIKFSVTLPGQIQVLPSFISGYHQARIEENLTYSVDGATISGSSLKALKDHETLTMTLSVTEEMFPQSIVQAQSYDWGTIGMGICGALALIYWLIAMWNLPVRRQNCTEPPQGFNAGQLGCIAAGQGVDLTMMVLSWAQLGYVLIQVDRSQRVLLHKRMDMGNERSETEQRYFKKLFGKRSLVDTSGYSYAQMCRMAARQPAGVRELIHPRTGNPKVFRVLASGIGLFGGACLAVALADGAILQGLLIFLMSIAGAFSGWVIQDVGGGVILRDQRRMAPGLILGGIWLLLSLLAGAFGIGLWMVAGLLLAGILLAWGGRRTELGRQTLAQVMGLRHYLCTADKQQLQRLCEIDPDYFFRLAPYAMALGADKAFAKRFGNTRLDRCPYLTTGMDAHMTALQWSEMMRTTADAMNERAQRLPLERLLGMLHSITRG